MVKIASDFCADFLSNVDLVGIPKSRHDRQRSGKGTSGIPKSHHDHCVHDCIYVVL